MICRFILSGFAIAISDDGIEPVISNFKKKVSEGVIRLIFDISNV